MYPKTVWHCFCSDYQTSVMTGPRLYRQCRSKRLKFSVFLFIFFAITWLLHYEYLKMVAEQFEHTEGRVLGVSSLSSALPKMIEHKKTIDEFPTIKPTKAILFTKAPTTLVPTRSLYEFLCGSFLADNFKKKQESGQVVVDDHRTSSADVLLDHVPASSTIQHNIHQMYKDEQIHLPYKELIQTWPRNHPQWKYFFWTDRDLRNLIADHYPEYLRMYDSYPHSLQRADAGRYFVLHRYGGVYADIDFESLRPIDGYLQNKSCILAPEPEEQSMILYNRSVIMTNSIMACAKGHPFLNLLITSLPAALRNHKQSPKGIGQNIDILHTTGPQLLQLVLEKFWRINKSRFNVTRAPYAELVPTTDHGQSFEFFCGCLVHKSRMGSEQKRACDRMKKTRWQIDDVSRAFSKHHWSHLGYENMAEKRNKLKVVPLAEIMRSFTINRYERG